jgi:hypothetical protein
VEENLEGCTRERLQSINTKAYLSIQDSEFEELLFKFDYREKVSEPPRIDCRMRPTESDERRKRERPKAAMSQKLEPRSGLGEQTGRPRDERTSEENLIPWEGSRDEGSITSPQRGAKMEEH